MRQILIIVVLVISCNFSNAKDVATGPKNSIGVLFSPGYVSPNFQVYGLGLRGTHSINKVFAYGAELNYQAFIGAFGNSDALGIIGFGRISPFRQGLFAELGSQANRVVSSGRSGSLNYISPYFAVGYEAKIIKNINAQFQVRPITFNGHAFELNGSPGRVNPIQKVCFGLSYTF